MLPTACVIGAGSSGIAAAKTCGWATWSATGSSSPTTASAMPIRRSPTTSSRASRTPKPNIARLTERTVLFADGSEVEAEVVVYCTA